MEKQRNWLIVAIFCALPAFAVTLVENQQPQAVIVTADKATRSARLAVAELNHYIQKMTGCSLQVVEESRLSGSEKNLILVGASKLTAELGLKNSDFAKQEYLIRSLPDKLIIMGADDEDYGAVDYAKCGEYSAGGLWDGFGYHGWRDRKIGTIYAADDFLRACGIRWYMPTELGEVVPHKTNIAFQDGELNIRRKPDFNTRASSFVPYVPFPKALYMKPGESIEQTAMLPTREKALYAMRHKEWGDGNIANHSFPSWKRKYKETHPEYAALQADGTRNFNQLCYFSPAVRNQIIEEWKEKLQAIPEGPIEFGLTPDDYDCWCHCPLCAPHLPAEPKTSKHFSNGYASNYVWRYAMEMAQIAAKISPRIHLSCAAYWDYYQFPTFEGFKLPDNFSVTICRTNLRRYGPLYAEESYTRENIENWAAALPPGKLIFWEYYNFPQFHAGNLLPAVFPQRIAADSNWKKELKAGGIFLFFREDGMKVYRHMAMEHIDFYVGRRFADNASLDIDQLLSEYYQLFYGPAEKPMRQFWETLELVCERGFGTENDQRLGANASGNPEPVWTKLCPPGKVEELRGYMNAALATAHTEPFKARVKLIDESTCQFMERLSKAYNRPIKDVAVACILHDRAPDISNTDDRTWDVAFPFRRFFDASRTIDEENFLAKMLSDGKNIYFRMDVKQNVPPTIKATARDGNVWLDDSVELFLKAGDSTVRQYVVNAKGILLDSLGRNKTWNGNAKAYGFNTPQGWSATLAIPLQELFDSGEMKLENFIINIVVNRPAFSSTWSICPLRGDNFEEGRFGKVLFMK